VGWPSTSPPPPPVVAPPRVAPSSEPRPLLGTWRPSLLAAPGSQADSSYAAAVSGPARSATRSAHLHLSDITLMQSVHFNTHPELHSPHMLYM
jgi:hypothetical protein